MLSDNIRNYRKENNMSQDELAEKLGVSRQSVSLWETGQSQPTIENIIALTKIFNVSSDTILGNDYDASKYYSRFARENSNKNADNAPYAFNDFADKIPAEKKKNKTNIILISVIAAIVIIAGVIWLAVSIKNKNSENGNIPKNSSVSQTESANANQSTNKTDSEKVSAKTGNTNNKTTTPATSQSPKTTAAQASVDIFTNCKKFAIKKGTLNGDYSIYQQPATRYGGYDNEYFSISYWSSSDMVELCLHCPLDDTYSVNFYLRMRGGYNKKYEYLSSRYYRSNGVSVRSASGYINPAVFSDKYPLSCDEYQGSVEGQNDFMEESRVGICDLIKCLKKFVEVENLDCDFSDFEFVNF